MSSDELLMFNGNGRLVIGAAMIHKVFARTGPARVRSSEDAGVDRPFCPRNVYSDEERAEEKYVVRGSGANRTTLIGPRRRSHRYRG